MIATRAISVQCPTCGALPDIICQPGILHDSGYVQSVTHQARINLAAHTTREANRKARTA